jgi:hypothetical protein
MLCEEDVQKEAQEIALIIFNFKKHNPFPESRRGFYVKIKEIL